MELQTVLADYVEDGINIVESNSIKNQTTVDKRKASEYIAQLIMNSFHIRAVGVIPAQDVVWVNDDVKQQIDRMMRRNADLTEANTNLHHTLETLKAQVRELGDVVKELRDGESRV